MKKLLRIPALMFAVACFAFTGCKNTEERPVELDASQIHEQPDTYHEERIDDTADTLDNNRDVNSETIHHPTMDPQP